MIVNPWDDFDRADGPLGTATPQGENWSDEYGTWAIDTNRAAATSIGPDAAVAVLPPPSGAELAPAAAEITITLPTGMAWLAGIVPTANFAGNGPAVAVDDSGQVFLGEMASGLFTSWDLWGSVDVTPGDHVLGVELVWADEIAIVDAWWDATWIGQLSMPWATAPDLGVALFTTDDTARFDDLGVGYPPLDMPSVLRRAAAVGGVVAWVVDPPGVMFLPSAPRRTAVVGGVMPPLLPSDLGPIFAPSVLRRPVLGGVHHTWSNTPTIPPLPWDPGYQFGPPVADLEVVGYTRVSASARPQLNDAGSGSFSTLPPGPDRGDQIAFRSGGSTVFTGYADLVTTVVADQGEEASQLVTVECPGMLGIDWGETIVYPDIAAYEPERTGQPAQDDRVWGWPMNGLISPDVTWTTSVGGDNTRYGTAREIFPLPADVPDNTPEWMWTTEVDTKQSPRGWSYFRRPFGAFPGPHSLFVCAYDWARVWIDGVPIATVEQAGTTRRVDFDLDWDYHLCAVEAFNAGGKAGVWLSLLRRDPDLFGGTSLRSGAGWKAIERPTVTMRATVGKVLRRLVSEARARGASAGEWTCAFSDTADSAGRPWPTGGDVPVITTRVGSTYMDVLRQMGEALIDFHAHPATKTLYAREKDTGGTSVAMPWTHTVDADSIVTGIGGR